MADKSKKQEDLSQIDKHLNSKLFQKFLQKEGDKLAEVSILPARPEPAKPAKKPEAEAKPNFRARPEPEAKANFRAKAEPEFYPEPKVKEERTNRRYEDQPEAQLKSRSKFTEEEEAYVQPQRYSSEQTEPVFRQASIKSPSYDDRPARSKWQEDPYVYREEDSYPRDSELKGFSDYIPPGESFVYFEPAEKPKAKAKPNISDYYPDPLIAISSNNQQVIDLEDRLRSKEMEINKYKQDIEHLKADLQDLEEKLDSKADLDRRLKNMRVEKEMHERKSRGLEEENDELKRQMQMMREDLENARFKADDLERGFKAKVQDLERELRNSRDRIADLDRDLSREKSKGKRPYQDDYQDYDRGYYDDERPSGKAKRDEYYQEEPRKAAPRKDDYYYEEPRKGKARDPYEEEPRRGKANVYEEEPRRGKARDPYDDEPRKKKDDWYQEPYQDKKNARKQDTADAYQGYSERGYFDKQPDDSFRPDKIKEQVKARIGATNSSSVSSALNWGEKPRKNDEVLNMENQILSLQIDKKRFEEELAKIPEHGKKIALIRRREEIENELAGIHSKIANLKIRVKQVQSKDN